MRMLVALMAAATLLAQYPLPGSGGGVEEAVKRIRVGTSDPGTCAVGDVIFRSDLTAGENLKLCTATNTWTQVVGSGGDGGADASTHSSSTTWTRAASAHGLGATCDLTFATYTVSGDVYTHTQGYSGVSCEEGDITITWPTATAGRLVLLKSGGTGGGGTPGGTDGQVQFNASGSFGGRACGAGIDCAAGAFRVDPAAVAPLPLTATASLDFGSTAQSACNELTISVSGAATGDAVSVSAPAAIEGGFVWSAWVSAPNTVSIRLCKITSGTVDPANATWRATVLKATW